MSHKRQIIIDDDDSIKGSPQTRGTMTSGNNVKIKLAVRSQNDSQYDTSISESRPKRRTVINRQRFQESSSDSDSMESSDNLEEIDEEGEEDSIEEEDDEEEDDVEEEDEEDDSSERYDDTNSSESNTRKSSRRQYGNTRLKNLMNQEQDEVEEDEEIDEEEEEDDDDDEDNSADQGDLSRRRKKLDLSRLTKRQRTMVDENEKSQFDFYQLDEPVTGKNRGLTEEEIALKRSEMARRRKNLSERRLEEERMETINRLLRRQATSRRGRTKEGSMAIKDASNSDNKSNASENTSKGQSNFPNKPLTEIRWVSRKSGEFLGIPKQLERFFEGMLIPSPASPKKTEKETA